MHREVPPLHVLGRLFSVSYVCARSIDRSAPGNAVRTNNRRRFRAGEAAREESRSRARLCGGALIDFTHGGEVPPFHPFARARAGVRWPLCFGRCSPEMFARKHGYRMTVAHAVGQVSTGRRYSIRTGVLRSTIQRPPRRAGSPASHAFMFIERSDNWAYDPAPRCSDRRHTFGGRHGRYRKTFCA